MKTFKFKGITQYRKGDWNESHNPIKKMLTISSMLSSGWLCFFYSAPISLAYFLVTDCRQRHDNNWHTFKFQKYFAKSRYIPIFPSSLTRYSDRTAKIPKYNVFLLLYFLSELCDIFQAKCFHVCISWFIEIKTLIGLCDSFQSPFSVMLDSLEFKPLHIRTGWFTWI